ncbi:hypothetical protein AB4238_15635 [Shewanella sp. 10N.286.45.A1]|uniref:hypothetical protein n=1 Tax=Shewanella sp. 10N.286.45.A1 TaxID=3229694 RepID=UPI00354DAE0B
MKPINLLVMLGLSTALICGCNSSSSDSNSNVDSGSGSGSDSGVTVNFESITMEIVGSSFGNALVIGTGSEKAVSLKVIALTPEGSRKVITDEIEWEIGDTALVKINNNSELEGLTNSSGRTTTITAYHKASNKSDIRDIRISENLDSCFDNESGACVNNFLINENTISYPPSEMALNLALGDDYPITLFENGVTFSEANRFCDYLKLNTLENLNSWQLPPASKVPVGTGEFEDDVFVWATTEQGWRILVKPSNGDVINPLSGTEYTAHPICISN